MSFPKTACCEKSTRLDSIVRTSVPWFCKLIFVLAVISNSPLRAFICALVPAVYNLKSKSSLNGLFKSIYPPLEPPISILPKPLEFSTSIAPSTVTVSVKSPVVASKPPITKPALV